MMAVTNIPLAGKPAEINLIGDRIYISLPDLCRIDIFSKSSFAKTSSIYFEHEVSSFCVDGNVIYYSEHDQHCEVFRRNMTTNDFSEITKKTPEKSLLTTKKKNIKDAYWIAQNFVYLTPQETFVYTVKDNTIFKKTVQIVGEQNGWGKLKSGAGWISLEYTKKC